MKLDRRKPDRPPVDLALRIPAEIAADLRAYCTFYQHTYNDKIELEALAVEMLQHFLRSDRAFRSWKRSEKSKETGSP